MAVVTRRLLMGAIEDEVRTFVVIEMALRPRFIRVAFSAFGPVMTLVIIVFEMAGDAFHVHVNVVPRVFAVTVVAGQLCVFAFEREVRVLRMVETRVGPIARIVAGLAIFPAAAVVGIVFSVATDAVHRRILMRLVFVAVPAFHVTMLANQREVRRVMVESGVGPVGRVVTVRALGAEIAFVHIVFAVTVDAFAGRIATFVIGFVAAGTLCFEMLAHQLEIREGMVKGRFVEPQDVSVAALVFGVACRAGAVTNIGRPAVKACTGIRISRHVLVAFETKPILRRAIKPLMARGAFGFDVGMPFDNRAGHYQRLNGLSRSGLAGEAG